jgi:hypothetical protein
VQYAVAISSLESHSGTLGTSHDCLEGGGLPRGKVRLLAAFARHEQIGRFGSRVLAAEFGPNIVVIIDCAI